MKREKRELDAGRNSYEREKRINEQSSAYMSFNSGSSHSFLTGSFEH
jgi:hypothetical protein